MVQCCQMLMHLHLFKQRKNAGGVEMSLDPAELEGMRCVSVFDVRFILSLISPSGITANRS